MRRSRALGGLVAAAVLIGACGSDGRDDAAPAATTAPRAFEGDPRSPFCQRSRAAAEEPVLDPFAPGLDAREVELRFRALAQRFSGFADLAPAPLEADLALLDERFDELGRLLADADYDFERLVGSTADLSLFDDPRLADIAERLAAYQSQVCSP